MRTLRTRSLAAVAVACSLLVAACDDDGSVVDADASDTQISDTSLDAVDGVDTDDGLDMVDTVESGDTTDPLDASDALADDTDTTGDADMVDPHDTADMTGTCVARACTSWMCGAHDDGCGGALACGACADETRVAADLAVVDALIAVLANRGYMADVIDLDTTALRDEAETILRTSPPTDASLIAALHHVMQGFANGHSGVYSASQYCASLGGADAGTSRYGACARPLGDDFVVTVAPASNPLDLQPGDRMVAVNGARGDAMVDAVLAAPLCSGGAGNAETRREHAATSVFAVLRQGDVIEVVGLDGETRHLAVPAALPVNQIRDCRDPLGRTTNFVARATLRDDGVAVIRIPRLAFLYGDPRANLPIDEYLDALTEEVGAAFDEVADQATAIVWDIRANIGGASPVAFAVAAGMPGAVADTPLARCTTRIADSDPIQYYIGGPDYDLTADDRFAFDGPTAVLIDGLSISAADYFARAVDLGTGALLVGRPTAGAWGGGGAYETLHEPLDLVVAWDPYRCNDLDGNPLETRSVQPDLFVEYDPADLAAGRDTVLEAAVTELLAP